MNVKAFKTFGDLAEHFIKCQQQCFPSAATVVGVVEKGSWNRSYWKRKDFFYCYVITARSKYQRTAEY
jgi:hypothetical protein